MCFEGLARGGALDGLGVLQGLGCLGRLIGLKAPQPGVGGRPSLASQPPRPLSWSCGQSPPGLAIHGDDGAFGRAASWQSQASPAAISRGGRRVPRTPLCEVSGAQRGATQTPLTGFWAGGCNLAVGERLHTVRPPAIPAVVAPKATSRTALNSLGAVSPPQQRTTSAYRSLTNKQAAESHFSGLA